MTSRILPFLILILSLFLIFPSCGSKEQGKHEITTPTAFERHGALRLDGVQLTDSHGEPVQLRGYNTYNLTFCPECVTRETIEALSGFWGAEVVRATMYVDDHWNDKSYNLDPELNKKMMDDVVTWCGEFGLYCIVDWHILTKGDPLHPDHAGAADFFRQASKKYADMDHVIYDICNEPSGEDVDWPRIAAYANQIIPIIRANDPDAIIIVGTPGWSSQLDLVEPGLLNDPENIMYAFHFYAASHLEHLAILERNMHRIPVFAAEWGACEYTGNGDLNFENSKKFMDLMAGYEKDDKTVSVSWAVFSFSDWDEAASMLKPESCRNGEWENMSPTGFFIREYILNPW